MEEAERTEEEKERRQVARARWALLRVALLGGKGEREGKGKSQAATPPPSVSKRAFAGFRLFERTLVADDATSAHEEDEREGNAGDHVLVRYTARYPPSDMEGSSVQVVLRQRREGAALARSDLSGFDNTGNICVWPGEEVLAHYCLHHPELFRHKRVCEVGAGFGLAGVLVAARLPCECVLITDGNDKAVQSIRASIKQNPDMLTRGFVRGEKLLWDRHRRVEETYRHSFDVVIAADCLFLHEYHEDLVHTLRELLRPGGHALIVAPQRGRTLKAFVERVRSSDKEWSVDLAEGEYDRWVWARHQELLARGGRSVGLDRGSAEARQNSKEQHAAPTEQVRHACASSAYADAADDDDADDLYAAAIYDPEVHYPLLLRLVLAPETVT